MAHECSMEVAWNCTSALLFPLPPSLPPSRRACARQLGRAHGRWRGLCSLLLFLLSDPSGSSDSLHYGSPSVRSRLHSISCLSESLSPSLSCLVSFHRSQPRSRRVEGSALSAHCRNPRTTAYEPARSTAAAAAWTSVPPLVPPPPPPRRGRPRPDSLSPAT